MSMEPFVLFGFLPPSFIVSFAYFEANPCHEARCGVVAFSLVLLAFQAFTV